MFVTKEGATNQDVMVAGDWSESGGKASNFGSNRYAENHIASFGVIIFSDNSDRYKPPIEHQKATVHEIGHLLGAGLADDGSTGLGTYPKEVYSGDRNDPTNETMLFQQRLTNRWSVMSRGWNDPVGFSPMNRNYIGYSIEELSTIDLHNIDTIDR